MYHAVQRSPTGCCALPKWRSRPRREIEEGDLSADDGPSITYNEWANEKILRSIDCLTPEELARPVDAYFGSLARNLQRILFAMRVWLARWKGETPPRPDAPLPESWRDAYAATHAELRAFVEPLTEAEADRVVSCKDQKGDPYQAPLGS